MTDISIVIPIYNMEKYIKQGLESILNQTFRNFEILLINDGSTDNSGKICDNYSKIDNRIKVIHKKNEGAGPSRNKGIAISTGKYIMFLDIDDMAEIDMLENMYNKIEQENVDLVICNHNAFGVNIDIKNAKDIKENYTIKGKENCKNTYIGLLKKGMNQPPWDKIYKSKIIKENNIKFPNLRRCQDAVFNCEYFKYVESYSVVKKSLYNYRVNDTKMAWTKFPKEFFDICLELDKKYVNNLENWGILDENAKEYLAIYFIDEIIQCMRYSFSPKWNFSYKDRKQYILNILNNKRTKQAIKLYKPQTKYKKIMKYFIENKYTIRLIIITKIDLFLRLKANKIFENLRAKYN